MTQPIQLQQTTIAGRRDGPHLLITGGVHGDEYEPMAAIRRLIGELDGAQINGRVTLVPVVNEAAFRRRERTAEDDLDLARICPGDPNGSVTERVAAALSELIRSADYYIDLHTGGLRYDVLPMVGYTLHRDPRVLETQRQMAEAFNVPVVWGTSGRSDGRSLSVARDAGVPAVYTEYYGGAKCNSAGVRMFADGCLNVAAALGMIERPAVESRIKYTVEDDRDESGHLQVMHPAPSDGFFEPGVTLGDVVEQGQVLGTIVDALGRGSAHVRAREAGVVLFLTTFPAIGEGQSVGGLLPITEPGSVRYERQ